jgi:hypothetical protein
LTTIKVDYHYTFTDQKAKTMTTAKASPRSPKTEEVFTPFADCHACGSDAEPETIMQMSSHRFEGRTRDGLHFNLIKWFSCRCPECGQTRIDRRYFMTLDERVSQ